MPENSAWYDQEGTCTLYKCIRENVGPSSVRMHTLTYPGKSHPNIPRYVTH